MPCPALFCADSSLSRSLAADRSTLTQRSTLFGFDTQGFAWNQPSIFKYLPAVRSAVRPEASRKADESTLNATAVRKGWAREEAVEAVQSARDCYLHNVGSFLPGLCSFSSFPFFFLSVGVGEDWLHARGAGVCCRALPAMDHGPHLAPAAPGG